MRSKVKKNSVCLSFRDIIITTFVAVLVTLSTPYLPVFSEAFGMYPRQFKALNKHVEVTVNRDGSLSVSESRTFLVGSPSSHLTADIKHRGKSLHNLIVSLDGEQLDELKTVPENYIWTERRVESGVFYVHNKEEFLTIYVVLESVDLGSEDVFTLDVSYQLEPLFLRSGDGILSSMDHGFSGGIINSLSSQEVNRRPDLTEREISFRLRFAEYTGSLLQAYVHPSPGDIRLKLEIDDNIGIIELAPVRLENSDLLRVRALVDADAVADAPIIAGKQLNSEAFMREKDLWLKRYTLEPQGRRTASGTFFYWHLLGAVLLFLSIFTAFSRFIRKIRIRGKAAATERDSDYSHLPLAVVATLYNALALQPKNKVMRLAGLTLFDLARSGHIKIQFNIGSDLVKGRRAVALFTGNSSRNLMPDEISELIQMVQFKITPVEIYSGTENKTDDLRPWQQVLLTYIQKRSGGKAISVQNLFPNKTMLKKMQESGEITHDQRKKIAGLLQEMGKEFRESYFDDLQNGFSLFTSRRFPVVVNVLGILVGYHLATLLSGLGFVMMIVMSVALFFAAIHRYEHTAEGLKYFKRLRADFNPIVRGKGAGHLNDFQLFAAFITLNKPVRYSELFTMPQFRLYSALDDGIEKESYEENPFGWPGLSMDYIGKQNPDGYLNFMTFVLQDLCYRAFRQQADISIRDKSRQVRKTR
ncbi:MAG: DUF2207 domain-containing protein [Balneolales bacterium]|nr:DUF2207 domain-containing protein [Balneolales bacterium]